MNEARAQEPMIKTVPGSFAGDFTILGEYFTSG
jgi:hypothetical protein